MTEEQKNTQEKEENMLLSNPQRLAKIDAVQVPQYVRDIHRVVFTNTNEIFQSTINKHSTNR
jgi:hypothetical protein